MSGTEELNVGVTATFAVINGCSVFVAVPAPSTVGTVVIASNVGAVAPAVVFVVGEASDGSGSNFLGELPFPFSVFVVAVDGGFVFHHLGKVCKD